MMGESFRIDEPALKGFVQDILQLIEDGKSDAHLMVPAQRIEAWARYNRREDVPAPKKIIGILRGNIEPPPPPPAPAPAPPVQQPTVLPVEENEGDDGPALDESVLIDPESSVPVVEKRRPARRPQRPSSIVEMTPDGPVLINITEDNLATLFRQKHLGNFRFDYSRRTWRKWDGTRWGLDRTEEAFDIVRQVVRAENSEGDPKWGRAATLKGVEMIAKADRAFAATGDEFDRDLLLLNTPEGTVDLRDGSVRPHRREDLITKITAVSPSAAPHPVFDKFLSDITCGDQSLRDYLQRGCGALLSGASLDHWLMFWYGEGRNGKNTLADSLLYILNDYAKKIPAATLMSDPRGNRHLTEIANLLGVRLALSSEVNESDYWDETRLKELTGDAVLAGRFMHKDHFEFPRTHKHVVLGNHRPMIRMVDPAISSRMHLVPFEASFTAEQGNLDPQMPDKLRVEAGAILAWLIEGHVKWHEDGSLRRCPAVRTATDEYFASQATIDMWIEERCIKVPDDGRPGRDWEKSSTLYKDYSRWKQDRGERPLGEQRFGEQIKKRFPPMKAAGVRYVGVLLREAAS